jgi:hypothetical protein
MVTKIIRTPAFAQLIHCFASLFDQEDTDSDCGADTSTGNCINTKNNIQAKTGTATLPILKARPPMTIKAATKWPKPGRTMLAIPDRVCRKYR